MTSYTPKRKQTDKREIIIQESFDQTSDIDVSHTFEQYSRNLHKIDEEIHTQNEKSLPALKIHKDKLLRYQPLKESNRQDQNKRNQYLTHKNVIATSALNKSNSIKMLKYIKHKVEINSKRLKVSSEKQNDPSRFFPKMPLKLIGQCSKVMNKTVSSINFKHLCDDKFNIFEVKQQKPLSIHSRFKTQQESNDQCNQKASEDLFGLNTNRSCSKLSGKVFNKTSSLSKFKSSNITSNAQISYSHGEIMSILSNMTQKQEQLSEQKRFLEQRIASLKEGIEKQHAFIMEIAKNKHRMSTSMARKEHQSKNSFSVAKLSKKKNQNFQTQAKDLEQQLNQTSNTNFKAVQSIEQEKQLIRMYELVIEQVKSQLKSQKKQKLQIQKKLGITKKYQKSLQSKLSKQQDTNKQILRKIYASLQRWS